MLGDRAVAHLWPHAECELHCAPLVGVGALQSQGLSTMKTIRVTLEEKAIRKLDRLCKRYGVSRSNMIHGGIDAADRMLADRPRSKR